jgi:hypothetical protein
MKVQVFHLFFKQGLEGMVPSDPQLYTLADDYVQETMAQPPDFKAYKNTWVACEVDASGTPVRCVGVLSMMFRPDFPICRFTDNAAVVKLVQRANDHLHDVYGWRGGYALVHIAKEDDRRCTDYEEWMKVFEVEDAERWAIKVR